MKLIYVQGDGVTLKLRLSGAHGEGKVHLTSQKYAEKELDCEPEPWRGFSNGMTGVVIATGNDEHIITVEDFSVYNADSKDHVVTLYYEQDGEEVIIYSFALAQGVTRTITEPIVVQGGSGEEVDPVFENWLTNFFGGDVDEHLGIDREDGSTTNYLAEDGVFRAVGGLSKATGAEINTGTDDTKYTTPKAIADSNVWRSEKLGQIKALVDKPTPADADTLVVDDSAATNAKKSVTWANVKATLKTYFDTLYNNYVLPLAGAARGGVKADTAGAGDTVEVKVNTTSEKLFVPTYPTVPVKATGADINTGSDDAKFATSKAIADSNVFRSEKAGQLAALTGKTTLVNGDTFVIDDSAASNAKKSVIWTNILASAKTYFDTLYNNYVLPLAGAVRGGVKADTKGAGDTVEVKIDGSTEKLYVPTYPVLPVKATGAEINTGSDDAKFVTPKSVKDSNIFTKEKTNQLAGLTGKVTPVDADVLVIDDSAAGNDKKGLTWANLKATLKTYFDTLYNKYVHPNHSGDVTSVGDGAQTIAATAISGKADAGTLAGTEEVLVNAGGTLKKTTVTLLGAFSNLWQRSGTTLSPATTGDSVSAKTFSSNNAAGNGGNFVGSVFGVIGTGTAQPGVLGINNGIGSGVVAANASGAATFDGQKTTALTDTTGLLQTDSHGTSGTAAAGFGGVKRIGLANVTVAEVRHILTSATSGAFTAIREWWGINAGTLARKMALAGNGQLTLDTYGANTHTGTVAKYLAVTSAGAVIEADGGGGGGTDEKVKYNADDTTAGYLADKTVAGTGITLAEGTGGDADKLKITNSDTGSAAVGTHESTYDHTKLHDPATAGTGISITGQVVTNTLPSKWSESAGVLTPSTTAARVEVTSNNATGAIKGISTDNDGIHGTSPSGTGVRGLSVNGQGGYFQSTNGAGSYFSGGTWGVDATGVVAGVRGQSNDGIGVLARTDRASTDSVIDTMVLQRLTSATPSAGIGAAIRYDIEGLNSETTPVQAGRLQMKLTTVTNGAENATYEILTRTAGTITRKLLIGANGQLTLDTYGAGTHTGTIAKALVSTSAGAIIETDHLPSKWNEASGVYTTTTSGARVELSNDSATKAPIEAVNANVLGSGAKFTGSLKGVDAVSTNGVAVYGSGVSGGQFEATTGAGVLARNTSKTDAGALRLRKETDATNTEVMLSEAYINTSGTAADGYGAYESVVMEASNGTNYEAFRKVIKWTSATLATLSSQMEFWLRRSGTWERKFAIKPTGQVVMDQYGAGNNTGTVATFPAFNSTGEIIEATAGQRNRIIISRSVSSNNTNFAAGDLGKQVISTAATAINLVIPLATLVVGDVILVKQSGAGQVTITAADGSKQTFENTAVKTSGVGNVVLIECVDATTNAEVFNVIGGVA